MTTSEVKRDESQAKPLFPSDPPSDEVTLAQFVGMENAPIGTLVRFPDGSLGRYESGASDELKEELARAYRRQDQGQEGP